MANSGGNGVFPVSRPYCLKTASWIVLATLKSLIHQPWHVFWRWSKHNEHIHYPRLEHPVSVDLITSSLWNRSQNKALRIWEFQPVCLVELRTLTQQIQECPEKIFFVSVHLFLQRCPTLVCLHICFYIKPKKSHLGVFRDEQLRQKENLGGM